MNEKPLKEIQEQLEAHELRIDELASRSELGHDDPALREEHLKMLALGHELIDCAQRLIEKSQFFIKENTPARPKRNRFRFSMRTMFVLIVVLAIPFGWIANERRHSRRDHEIAEQLRVAGFYAALHVGSPYDTWERFVQAGNPQGWVRRLARQVLGERVLFLGSETVPDITPLTGLRNVRVLGLDNTPVTDFTPLAEHTQLQVLSLGNTQISDLSSLAGLCDLQSLDLRNTQVRDVSTLFRLSNLKKLNLTGAPVSDDQVLNLQRALPNCEIAR